MPTQVARLSRYLLMLILIPLATAGLTPLAQADGPATPSGIPVSQLEQHVDEFAQGVIGRDTAGAAIIVVNNGQIILNKAYGDAVLGQTPATTDDVWEWGSVSKLLVWTSAYQLVEQGKLDLNADIRQYLPTGFLKKLRYDKPITFLNLMHHNAGWEDVGQGPGFTDDPALVPDLEQALSDIEPNQIWEPGTIQAYSNYGAALAGFIVQRISGEPYYDYARHHIFTPLGMTQTTVHPTQADNPAVAARRDQIVGYKVDDNGELVPAPYQRIYMSIYPAGSATGTIGDLGKFMMALMDPAAPLFAKPATQAAMESTSYWIGSADSLRVPALAHGFFDTQHAVRTIGHGGNLPGFSANLTFAPATGFGVVVLTNQEVEGRFTGDLVTSLFGPYKPPTYHGALPDAHEVEGKYASARMPFTDFIPQDYLVTITAKDENTITISAGNFSVDYVQIAPYVFALPLGNGDFNPGVLYFDIIDGTVMALRIASEDQLLAPGPALTQLTVTWSETFSTVSCLLDKTNPTEDQWSAATPMKSGEPVYVTTGDHDVACRATTADGTITPFSWKIKAGGTDIALSLDASTNPPEPVKPPAGPKPVNTSTAHADTGGLAEPDSAVLLLLGLLLLSSGAGTLALTARKASRQVPVQ